MTNEAGCKGLSDAITPLEFEHVTRILFASNRMLCVAHFTCKNLFCPALMVWRSFCPPYNLWGHGCRGKAESPWQPPLLPVASSTRIRNGTAPCKSHASKRPPLTSRVITHWNAQQRTDSPDINEISSHNIVQSTANHSNAQGRRSHIAMHSDGLYTTSGGSSSFNVMLVGLAARWEVTTKAIDWV
jgi:hypothetical protein